MPKLFIERIRLFHSKVLYFYTDFEKLVDKYSML